MTLKELLGDGYKEGMTLDEAETALKGKNLVDLSTGDYVSKNKYNDDMRALSELKAKADGEDERIKKAIEDAKKAYKAELDKQYESERNADKRKRARDKAYNGLSDEQKSIFDAFVKDEELKLADDGESFANWDEVAKPIKEKYKTLFPNDPGGSKSRAGLGFSSDPALSSAGKTALDIAREAAGLTTTK